MDINADVSPCKKTIDRHLQRENRQTQKQLESRRRQVDWSIPASLVLY